jgi:hypothetical protein
MLVYIIKPALANIMSSINALTLRSLAVKGAPIDASASLKASPTS